MAIRTQARRRPRRGGPRVADGLLVVCAAAAMWSSPVAAQQSRGAAPYDRIVGRQCEVDLRARCDVVSGQEAGIRGCLKQQFDSVADECKAWLAHLAAIDKACAADIKQSCADVQRGHSRIEACLRSAVGKLSDACKDGLAKTVSSRR